MEVVKKNIVSILCGVVALASIIFYFVAAKPKFSALEKEMKDRVGKPDEMKSAVRAEYFFPATSGGPPMKLPFLPNQTAMAQVDKLVSELQKESADAMNKAMEINRFGRELLIPGSLPRPSDNIPAFDFRAQYAQVLKRGGNPDATKTKVVNLPDAVLRSAEPPTSEEIAAAKDKEWKEKYYPQIIFTNNQPANLKEVYTDFVKATENFDEEFRRKRAEQFKVYLEPGALTISPVAEPGQNAPSPQAMWFAQMSLWVQQDVCNSIAEMNRARADFVNIRTTPIKHLISVDIKPDLSMYAIKGGQINTLPGQPAGDAAPSSDGSLQGSKDFNVSATGRICNSMYDVVHFGVDAVVDARYVKAFLQQLQFGRFITVLEVDVQGVDLDEALDEGYEYGKHPVVEIRVKCEAMFLRSWTAWVPQPKAADGSQPPAKPGPMPLDVQKMLGIQPPGQENKPADASPTAAAS